MSFWSHNPYLAEQLEIVNRRLLATIKSREKILQEAAYSLISAPAKRMRPALTIIAGSYGKPKPGLIDVAAAIELLHMATLVHDDIIDEVELRRGVPTTQSKYGKDVAVYTGDFLLVKSLQLIAKTKASSSLTELARILQFICEGEVNQYSDRYNVNPSFLKYFRRIRAKTAMMFALSAAAGAKYADCEDYVVKNLAKYGLYFGMAFQIQDDIFDLISTEENLGKPVGSDLREGIYTLPVIFALKHNEIGPILKQHLGKLPNPQTMKEIVQLVIASGAIEKSRQVMEWYLKKAESQLTDLPENNNAITLRLLLQVPFQSERPFQEIATIGTAN